MVEDLKLGEDKVILEYLGKMAEHEDMLEDTVKVDDLMIGKDQENAKEDMVVD